MTSPAQPSERTLADQVAAARWYHTIELPGGIVTPGWFDTRRNVDEVPLPRSLEGKRCLDVGTWDGFWAFEMERRGAAEVVAIDVLDPRGWDWPPRVRLEDSVSGQEVLREFRSAQAFLLAHEALGSRVERREQSVYELDPERDGTFDFVFLGSLLLHLRDPVAALAALRSVCTGEAVIADTVELFPSLLRPRTPSARLEAIRRPWWWMPNVAAFRRMVEAAGFEILEATGVYYLPYGPEHPRAPLRSLWRKAFSAAGREEIVMRLRGIPHAAVRARPLG